MIQLDFTKTHYPQTTFFIRWAADWAIVHQNNAAPFMADPWWVHLEQLNQDPLSAGWKVD